MRDFQMDLQREWIIKVIKRVGFEYKNFEFFRLRLLYILRGKISGKNKKDGFQKSQKSKKSKREKF